MEGPKTEGTKKYLKLVAFVPAIVLVGGFVGYRAGAFELPWLSKPTPQEPATPQAAIPPVEQPPSPPAPEQKETFLPGSKSTWLYERAPEPEAPPFIMFGSKSAPIIPLPAPTPNAQQPPPVPPNPVFMGGSKSKIILEPVKPAPPPNPAPNPPKP